jgi:hypothetical protein
MNDALTMYVGSATCSDIARLWGVWAGRSSAPEVSPRQQAGASGRTAGQGLLRWQRQVRILLSDRCPLQPSLSAQSAAELPIDIEVEGEGVGPFGEAMASVAKAIVGAVFQEHVSRTLSRPSLRLSVAATGLRTDAHLCPRQLVLSQGGPDAPAQMVEAVDGLDGDAHQVQPTASIVQVRTVDATVM